MSAKQETKGVDLEAEVAQLNKRLAEQEEEYKKVVDAYEKLSAKTAELAEFIKRLTGL